MADVVLYSSRKRRKLETNPYSAETCAHIVSFARSTAHEANDEQQQEGAKSFSEEPPADQITAKKQRTPAQLEEDRPVSFGGLGLNACLLNVLKALDITSPTDIQRSCIPAILQGRSCIGVSHTGSGKTATFALPILQRLAANPYGVFALVLTPTRELALQIQEQFRALGAGMQLRECCCIGGMNMQQQGRELQRQPHVVVATPGRLASLLEIDGQLADGFRRLQVLVLDEADRILDETFAPQLRLIVTLLPQKRQTLLFSATMSQNLICLQKAALSDAHLYEAYHGLATAEQLQQQYMFMPSKVKDVYLYYLLSQLSAMGVRSAIVFVGTCKGCHLLGLLLDELDIICATLHSHKPQSHRATALQRFKAGAVSLLLATDVASRGLDIPTVDMVINYDLPMLARDYVHRVGRTARAGRCGLSVSMVTQYDIQRVQQIELLTQVTMQEMETPENEVLKSLTRVYAARRAAGLRMIDDEAGGKTYRSKRIKLQEHDASPVD